MIVFLTCLIYAHPHVKHSGLTDKPSTVTGESVQDKLEPVEEGKVKSHTGSVYSSQCISHKDMFHNQQFIIYLKWTYSIYSRRKN